MPLKTSIACALIMFATSAFAQRAERAVLRELDVGLSQGFPSVSMAIATRQGVIWEHAVGYADLPSRSRAHPAYLYGMGSITKVLVACVIEQLVQEGRLPLETPISDLLEPAVIAGIPNADRATVKQLLDHTSGIPSWEFDPEWIRDGRGERMDLDHRWGKAETLDYLRSGRDAAAHPPGQGYSYSNTNYTLLGLLIERVTGQDAVSEIHRRLLLPLGLTDIYFEGYDSVDANRLPSRYHFGTAEFSRTAGIHPSFRHIDNRLIDVSKSRLATEWTAGAALSTARDLALLARDLRDGRAVSEDSLRRMEAFRATDDPDEDMGQGLALDRYGDQRLIGYTGNVLGFGAAVGWVPDEDVVIALMTNVGAMHAGNAAYFPEKFLKQTHLIAAARRLARELAPRASTETHVDRSEPRPANTRPNRIEAWRER